MDGNAIRDILENGAGHAGNWKRLCVPLAKLRVVPEGTVISKADLLVLAEPTNHLDIKAPGPPEDDPGKH